MTDSTPKRGYMDLVEATGLNRETVKAYIRSGQLPGYVVGRSYIVPAEAFDDFIHGRWEPRVRPVKVEPIKPKDFIRQRKE
jgi:excisionase family DNA binding protein